MSATQRLAVLVGVEDALATVLAERLAGAGYAVQADAPADGAPVALVVLGRGPDRTATLDGPAGGEVAAAVEAGLDAAHAAVARVADGVMAARGTVVVLAPLGEHAVATRVVDSVLDAALLMLGRLLGAELAAGGARALVLCPDPAVPHGDVAEAVIWAAAAPAVHVNGAVIQLDAARTATLPMPSEEDAHA